MDDQRDPDKLALYSPFTKIDFENQTVEGVFTSETLDAQGDIMDFDATKAAVEDYKKWMNVREMHQPSAVGVGREIVLDEVKKQATLRSHIVDKSAWEKVVTGVYKGYSIGGKAIERKPEMCKTTGTPASRVTKYRLDEVSIVDRPANPDSRFTLVKRDDPEDSNDFGKAVWTTQSVNDLPDSSFAFIEAGGTKDSEGKTTPRSLRHLPYKGADGKIDLPHLRNALARLSQTDIPAAAKAEAQKKLDAAAKDAGIGEHKTASITGDEKVADPAPADAGQQTKPETVALTKAQYDELSQKAAKVDAFEKRLVEMEERVKKDEEFDAEFKKRLDTLQPVMKALAQPTDDETKKAQEAVKKMSLGDLAKATLFGAKK